MISREDVQSLAEFKGEREVLSVYLDTDLSHQSKDAVKLTLKECVKNLAPAAAEDIAAVGRYLDFEYDWQSRGLALFSAGDALWQAVPLPVAVECRATFAERPSIRGLTEVLDRIGQYGVALVDRQNVRLFSVAWGAIEAESESFGEALKRHKQGGWAAARYQRHEDNLALHNLKQAVEVIGAFCEDTGCDELLLGGSPEVLSQVKDLMPKALRERVVAEFPADIQAAPNDVLARTQELAAEVDSRAERQLVEEVITATAKGGPGVTGLNETLQALHRGQVRRLLVGERYHAAGFVCGNCGFVAASHSSECPFCHYPEVREAPDVVDLAIRKALQTGAEVTIVRETEGLGAAGGIAALLRYA